MGPLAGKPVKVTDYPASWPWILPSLSWPLSPQALLALLCWLWHGLAHPASWLKPLRPPATPPGSPPCSFLLDSSHSSNWDDDSIGWVRAGLLGGGGEMGCPRGQTPYRGQAPGGLVVNRDPSHEPGPHHTLGRAPRLVGVQSGLV